MRSFRGALVCLVSWRASALGDRGAEDRDTGVGFLLTTKIYLHGSDDGADGGLRAAKAAAVLVQEVVRSAISIGRSERSGVPRAPVVIASSSSSGGGAVVREGRARESTARLEMAAWMASSAGEAGRDARG